MAGVPWGRGLEMDTRSRGGGKKGLLKPGADTGFWKGGVGVRVTDKY